MESLRLDYNRILNEYCICYLSNNVKIESKSYYTDDKADAEKTMKAMQKEIDLARGLTSQEEQELKFLKEHNKYLNQDGQNRLAKLWEKQDNSYEAKRI